MNTFLFPPALLLLTVSIHGVTLAQNKHSDDSLYNVASTIVSNIKAFDRTTDPKDARTFMIPYSDAPKKKTRVVVTTINKIVRKMTYISYDESLTTSAKESYYFDTGGKLIVHSGFATGTISYDVYMPPYFVIFNKAGDPLNSVAKDNDTQFHMAEDKYVIDYYLGASGFSTYSVSPITLPAAVTLKITKAMSLRQAPSFTAATITALPKGTHVQYLDRSPNSDSVAHIGSWIWYKVKTTSGQTGWLWGYPTGLSEVTDEEY
jgi:hypothetical protein